MTEPPIDVSGLVKRFGGYTAVGGLDLRVGPAEVHGFLGPNGAGKSTTIRVLLGLHHADAGRVRVLGRDPARQAAEVTRRISYVPGEVTLWPNLTGQEILDAFAGLRGSRDKAAEKRLAGAFALDTGRLVRTYSKGNRQKVALVAAFAARTDLLILDEPTSGLDPLMEEVFQGAVRDAAAAGRTVLLSSHILGEVEDLCDAVTIIKDGHLVESGQLSDMRHLAASVVTAHLPGRDAATVMARLRQTGLTGETTAGTVRLAVPRDLVPAVLAILADADAPDITCTPASLEDLFLRHYVVAPR
ncbi:ABC transporter ATP-binding protein [Actinoplanes palleronii]|uniref:ABC transporter ATP-binding protein n=1 Tax=Actinoplanes palleronii TaxID=113570 RepID=A0ABQ4BSH2_9ACTN|nr:ABC transporter ATP-binding protein [Actinoplanes palleronii]GIE73135.1 ABC transporter ATP-binding protein [Actinoplanes palleronii]